MLFPMFSSLTQPFYLVSNIRGQKFMKKLEAQYMDSWTIGVPQPGLW